MKELFKDFLFGLTTIVAIVSVLVISLWLELVIMFSASGYTLRFLRILLLVLGVVVLGKGIRKAYNYIRGLF